MGTYRISDATWSAFGDPSRRAIIERLAERPQSVRELADQLPISRPAVSQHLKALKVAGLVTDHPFGTKRIYQLNATAVGALRDQLDTYWSRALSAYKDAVEQPEGDKR
ncbi:ArsR/SmtB family transcription factor [Amycolatopsis sp. TRM77291]